MFTAVLYPSAAVEHSFNGVTITTKAGAQIVGYIISDTADELVLKIAGGAQQVSEEERDHQARRDEAVADASGLSGGDWSARARPDLVAWMQTLK